MKKLLIGLSAFLLFSPLHVFAAESGLSDTALDVYKRQRIPCLS